MIYILTFFSIIYLLLILKRVKKYKYNQKQNYMYDLQTKATCKNHDTSFLEIKLYPTLCSYIFKPYICVDGVKTFFEYGAKGVRYINISHVKDKTPKPHFIKIDKKTKIFNFKNEIDLNKKILILSPHADDAEIASFGLYNVAKDVTIVTTTIGENGNQNYKKSYNNTLQATLKKAQLRTLDALCTPFLGGVEFSNTLTLGYNGGSLQPLKNKQEFKTTLKDITPFRKTKHSCIKLPDVTKPTYETFLNDINEIVKQLQPEIIITPHPQIDSHPDHKQTTLTLLEVLKQSNLNPTLLLYTNHLQLSETYPLGNIGSSITLPPNKEDFIFNSIYSFKLDQQNQTDKFFALENIHDLRDSYLQTNIKSIYKHLIKLIKRKITSKDKSYYKRAIRDNELFFVATKEDF